MYLHRKLEFPELLELLVIHTNRFSRMMIYGEKYSGEYEICKRTIETIQNEIIARQPSTFNHISGYAISNDRLTK